MEKEKTNKTKLCGIFVRLTENQHKKLKEISKKSDIPIASLMRSAVREYLQEKIGEHDR